MKSKYSIVIISLLLILNSCCFKLTKNLKEKNPTNYCFNINLKSVNDTIRKTFENGQYRGMDLYLATDTAFWNEQIFSQSENKNDFYLASFEFIGKSAIYYSWWGRLKMNAEFHIHLDSLGENLTKVTIIPFNEDVATGFRLGRGDNTFIIMCTQPAIPSSVEEYEILTLIGKSIGEKNMPKLMKPKLF